jgi:Ca2+:H+ antiporter
MVRSIPKQAILALLVPLAFLFKHQDISPVILFLLSAGGILGLISLIGKSVEEIDHYSGPVIGGLLNATFGNFTELVIAINGVRQGLFPLIRASIVGSILGNLILVIGLSMFCGGLKHKTQTFSRTGASTSVLMLLIVMTALMIPSIASNNAAAGAMDPAAAALLEQKVSFYSAILLLLLYGLGLFFSLFTHRFAYMPKTHGAEEHAQPDWSKLTAIIVLCAAACTVAATSDVFVESIQEMLTHSNLPLTEVFMGVFVVAAIGNAVDGLVAVKMALKNKMDVAIQVAMGASIQVALLIAPILVIFSNLIGGHPQTGVPFTLRFPPFEVVALGGGVLLAGFTLQDGESNWFEGVMFVTLYAIFGIAFFFLK